MRGEERKGNQSINPTLCVYIYKYVCMNVCIYHSLSPGIFSETMKRLASFDRLCERMGNMPPSDCERLADESMIISFSYIFFVKQLLVCCECVLCVLCCQKVCWRPGCKETLWEYRAVLMNGYTRGLSLMVFNGLSIKT